MRFWNLTTNERGDQLYTQEIEITADDLDTTATNTAKTITIPFTFAVGDFVERITTKLKTVFKDASDAAFNATTMSVGDSVGGVATILAAIETNENGTEIVNKTFVPTGVPSTGFTAATNLTVTFNSMAAKALNDIDTGVLGILLRVNRPNLLFTATSYGPIQTK